MADWDVIAKQRLTEDWSTLRAAYLPLNQAMRRTVECLEGRAHRGARHGEPGLGWDARVLVRLRLLRGGGAEAGEARRSAGRGVGPRDPARVGGRCALRVDARRIRGLPGQRTLRAPD